MHRAYHLKLGFPKDGRDSCASHSPWPPSLARKSCRSRHLFVLLSFPSDHGSTSRCDRWTSHAVRASAYRLRLTEKTRGLNSLPMRCTMGSDRCFPHSGEGQPAARFASNLKAASRPPSNAKYTGTKRSSQVLSEFLAPSFPRLSVPAHPLGGEDTFAPPGKKRTAEYSPARHDSSFSV